MFFTLFVGRFVTLCALCLADQNTLSFPVELRLFLALPILCLAGYTMYSIKRFFGFARAAGIDHFDSEYRNRPLVREGVFRWTSNAMYVFAIQSLWLFGILAASKLALVAAAFQAIYIWVHYYGTENPTWHLSTVNSNRLSLNSNCHPTGWRQRNRRHPWPRYPTTTLKSN